ncbi:YqaA family protein [Sulfurospirillum arcachonense]|uniref:YqaA family protein n=1 Tax=Sulfurospirillum arcachonense TaxID=57666 RepID=UPI00046A8001|nr:YqaA family protein [Sulfurospirillum arcachonense]
MVYLTLFFTSLGAATLLPGGSEALLLYYKSQGLNTFLLLSFATTGNTLGSVINYFLGKYFNTWAVNKKYISDKNIKKAEKYFEKYGAFALLLAWVPIIGDPITFVAGILRYAFWKFFVLVLLSKLLRYAFLLYMYEVVT